MRGVFVVKMAGHAIVLLVAMMVLPLLDAVSTGVENRVLQAGKIRMFDVDLEKRAEWKERLGGEFQRLWNNFSAVKAPGAWIGVSDPEYGREFFYFGNAVQDENGTQIRAPNPDDHLGIGSITKTMVATTFLELVQEGKLSLNQTVADLVPDFAAKFPPYAIVTVKELLGMASGVPDYLNNDDGMLGLLYAHPDERPTIFEIVAFATRNASEIKPPGNENAAYSTTNYSVLAFLAEKLTNQTMSALVQTRVFDKLGMSQSGLPLRDGSGVLPAPFPNSYLALTGLMEFSKCGVTGVKVGQDMTDFAKTVVVAGGGGAAYTTIGDLLTYAESGLGNSLITKDMVEERLRWKKLSEGIEYGLGMIKGQDGWYGHSGDAFGFSAQCLTNEQLGASLVAQFNSATSTLFAEFWLDAYKKDLAARRPSSSAGSEGDLAATTTEQMPNSRSESLQSGSVSACRSISMALFLLLIFFKLT